MVGFSNSKAAGQLETSGFASSPIRAVPTPAFGGSPEPAAKEGLPSHSRPVSGQALPVRRGENSASHTGRQWRVTSYPQLGRKCISTELVCGLWVTLTVILSYVQLDRLT